MSELPPTPNLEQLKKQAKDLRKAHKALNPETAARIRAHLPRMADHSDQEILKAPFSLQEAQHVIARVNGFRSWRELHAAAVSVDSPMGEDGLKPAWRARFDAVYHLTSNEVLKRVSLPFIPERAEYFVATEPTQAAEGSGHEPPDTFFLIWEDDQLTNWGYGYVDGAGLSLDDLLWHLFRIPSSERGGPQDLMASRVLCGDWIFRRTPPVGEKLAALAEIWSSEQNRSFEFEQVGVDREVIVANGVFKLIPLKESSPDTVYMYFSKEELEHRDAGDIVESMTDLLLDIGNRVGMPMQNHVSNDFDLGREMRLSLGAKLHLETDREEKARKLRILLANLSAQTGLSFSLVTQPVHIWQFQEKEQAA